MVKKIKNKKRESLIILTRKLIDFIFKRGFDKSELDLETVSTELNIKKRRLYDLTNVLEGIGYLKKHKRNLMKISIDFFDRILFLKTRQLTELENKLNNIKIEKTNDEENNFYENISFSINEEKKQTTFEQAFNEIFNNKLN